MKFHEVVKNLITPSRPEMPLSRIYGYKRMADGKIQIVDDEAKIITKVIDNLASRFKDSIETILDGLIAQFNEDETRNRSGRRWTRNTLLGLVRPTYAGIKVSPNGVWRRSTIYPPIVSLEKMKTAIRRLKKHKRAQ